MKKRFKKRGWLSGGYGIPLGMLSGIFSLPPRVACNRNGIAPGNGIAFFVWIQLLTVRLLFYSFRMLDAIRPRAG